MQPSVNERVRGVGIAGPLRGGAEADLAGEARIAVRHADGGSLMMSMNVSEPMLFAQLDNDVLVGVAHDRENVIDAFSRNRGASASSTFMATSTRWAHVIAPQIFICPAPKRYGGDEVGVYNVLLLDAAGHAAITAFRSILAIRSLWLRADLAC